MWDHRNASLREWIVQEHVMGARQGMGNANVSGFYFDDYWLLSGEDWSRGPAALPQRTAKDVNLTECATGPSELDQHCLLDTGLSADDVVALMEGWRRTIADAMRAVHAAGGWVWQMFNYNSFVALNGSECVAQLREACTATSPQQTRMTYYELAIKRHSPGWPTDPAADVARFRKIVILSRFVAVRLANSKKHHYFSAHPRPFRFPRHRLGRLRRWLVPAPDLQRDVRAPCRPGRRLRAPRGERLPGVRARRLQAEMDEGGRQARLQHGAERHHDGARRCSAASWLTAGTARGDCTAQRSPGWSVYMDRLVRHPHQNSGPKRDHWAFLRLGI